MQCFCSACGKSIERSLPNKTGKYFCTKKCRRSLSGVIKSDYRKLAFEAYDKVCQECGWKEYPEVLVVHHMDLNHDNNRIDNLQVLCPNCHAVTHLLESEMGQMEDFEEEDLLSENSSE